MERTANNLKNSPKGQLIYKRTSDVKKLLIDVENCIVPSIGVKNEISPLPPPPPQLSLKEEEYEEQAQSNKSFGHILLPMNEEREKNIRNEINVKTKQSSPRTPEYLRSKLVIEEYKGIFENQSKVLKKKKTSEFHKNDEYITLLVKENLEDLRKKEEDCKFSQMEKIHNLFKQGNEEIVKLQKCLLERHIHHHETNVQKFQETKRKQEEAAQKDREQKLEQFREEIRLSQAQNELFSLLLKKCQYKKHLTDIDKYEAAVTSLNTMVNDLALAESTGNVTAKHFEKAASILEELKSVNKIVKLNVEIANQKGKEEEKSLKAQQETASPEKVTNEQVASTEPSPKPQEPEDSDRAKALKVLSQYIDPVVLKEYKRLCNKLKEVEQNLEPFLKNLQLKEYIFSIRKAANTLINAISPVSGTHLKDKLTKLTMLVQGHTIEVSNKHISAKEQPEGITYAIYFIAKMIVKKGAEQVSSSHESAFAIALIAVGLWQNFPEFGELLLANFYLSCPYIVPFYIPQQDGQSTEEYHKSLGYKYENGRIEEQERFLKRMTGIMRLYAAIIVSPPPLGSAKSHPHGIENSWIWITRILNMKPRPDITAAMIYNILEVTGHSLFLYYQKPFQKLLHILITEFLPKIKAVSASAGSVSRLETFLEVNLNNKGQIATPYGYLASSFWLS